MGYSKNEIIEIIKKRSLHLYQVKELMRVLHANNALDYILENEIELINGEYFIKDAKKIERAGKYNVGHTPKKDKPRSKKLMVSEKWLVKNMCLGKIECKDAFGEIVDYEVPLNDKQDDGTGDIDFISKKDGKLWMVEIKNYRSGESILKAILEIQSYYQIVNKEKLIAEFPELEKDVEIEKVVAIFDNTSATRQLQKNTKIKELIRMFNIKVIILNKPKDENENKVSIKEIIAY